MLCISVVLSLFAGRLVQLQGLQWSKYRGLAAAQRIHTIPIPAVRGSITAGNGAILAMTAQTDLIYADPTQMPLPSERRTAATKLAGPLGMTPAAILNLFSHPAAPEYVVLKQSVSSSVGEQIAKLNLQGIVEDPSYARVYPNGDLAASLLGFTAISGTDMHGAAGLEFKYNSLLAGQDGKQEVETGPGGQPIPFTPDKVHPLVPAGGLQLTIQPDLQYEAEQACAERVRITRADNCSVIILQPGTGKILAMAQYPTFNPDSAGSVAQATNIPAQDVFEPGSTAKVITVAAALERGGQTAMSPYNIPPQISIHGFTFHDAEVHGDEHLTIAGILANSSNVGMVQVVGHVSPSVQYRYYRKFGLGSPSGLGLPAESPGILPPVSQWNGETRYTMSFGQGVAATAIQMADVYAAIANGGVRVSPSIVAGTTNSKGKFVPAAKPKRTRVLKAKTARELMKILQQVPIIDDHGGEPWGEIAGYSIAAKTGTAQLLDPKKGCLCEYGSSYIGIAPANNPQLVVAVHVENPKRKGYFGDQVAGPVFNQVMKFALQTEKIAPTGEQPPKVRLRW